MNLVLTNRPMNNQSGSESHCGHTFCTSSHCVRVKGAKGGLGYALQEVFTLIKVHSGDF